MRTQAGAGYLVDSGRESQELEIREVLEKYGVQRGLGCTQWRLRGAGYRMPAPGMARSALLFNA